MIDGSGTINPAHLNTPGKEVQSTSPACLLCLSLRCTLNASIALAEEKHQLFAQGLRHGSCNPDPYENFG